MNKSARRIKGLGEVSIRVSDLDAMHKFYEEVVELEVPGGTRVLFSSKSQTAMAVIHRISPSSKQLTPCFLITRLYS